MADLTPNVEFAKLASDEQIQKAIRALEVNGMHAIVIGSGHEARKAVHDLLPSDAEVFTTRSKTLVDTGVADDIENSGRYQPLSARLMQLDMKTHGSEMRKLGAGPEYVVGSVHAVTEEGQVLIASATGSQLASYVYGAGKVIWVVGTQKIVRDLDTGMRRIYEYSYPMEDARARKAYGIGSGVNKILIVNKEAQAGRINIVFVKENLGF